MRPSKSTSQKHLQTYAWQLSPPSTAGQSEIYQGCQEAAAAITDCCYGKTVDSCVLIGLYDNWGYQNQTRLVLVI